MAGNDELLLWSFIVVLVLFSLLTLLPGLESISSQPSLLLEVRVVRLPGLEDAYRWVKRLTLEGYQVELRYTNEDPVCPYEVYAIRQKL